MTTIEIIVITTTANICIIKREPRFPLNPFKGKPTVSPLTPSLYTGEDLKWDTRIKMSHFNSSML
jgi:hypothetical protein